MHLPSYSPNLNLIERYWKLVRKNCLNASCKPTFQEFKADMGKFIEDTPPEHMALVKSIITEKFQLFDDVKVFGEKAA
jgi:hypothetical protein